EFKLFAGNLKYLDGQKLISFAFHIEKSEPLKSLDKLNETYDDIFLLRTPNSKLSIAGINSAINFQQANANNFSSVTHNYNYWKKNFINNWSKVNVSTIPIICCSAKFDPNNSSSLWDDFDPLRIYIPEFLLAFQGDKSVGYYNFIINDKINIDFISKKLSTYLQKYKERKTESPDSIDVKASFQSKLNDDAITSWNDISLKALTALKKGDLDKLVLSRAFSFNINNQINWDSLIQKLYKRFTDCYLFFIKKNDSIFFGSSPEMFLKVSENIAEVESVAGSAARGKETGSDYELEKFLQSSEKNHQEHLFVSDFITNVLIKYSNNVRVIEEKQIRKLDNIQHLLTRISAELNFKENLFELIDSLFPTPAVCGVPKEKAINLIRKIETHDRGLYSGLVGIIDFDGNCEFAVTIRSALFKDNQVTAFAGAGLVKDSDPQEEFLETKLKLNTVLSLFTDENKS
ncbi:MAG: chorismate-binding protein, partial [Ignavibacteriaceae bacterium]|nr:chorismate-binding protein [Ignavibacteriaceae bacterium]